MKLIVQTEKEIEGLYTRYLVRHFPLEEVKPLKNIISMHQQGQYKVYALEKENIFVGYAFFSCVREGEPLLLDYFAILEEYRSRGYGSELLSDLRHEMDVMVLIETEDIACAQNEAQRLEREKRDMFYEKNGVRKTSIIEHVYDANYVLWYLWKEEVSEEICYQKICKNYQMMVSEEAYRTKVKIDKKEES